MLNQQSLNISVMTITLVSCFLLSISTTFASTTITVDRAVHVTTAEGSNLVLDAGDYVVEPAEEWIRITPSNGKAVDAHLLEAHLGKHEESLTDPLAISATGIEPDSHHLVLLLPDGKSFESTGSYSGIRSRGRLSRLSIKRLRALAASRRSTQRTEYITPLMGGSGGNRSYNLDCGNNAVLVGTTFKAGSWVDALGIVCQRVNPQTGALGDDFTRGPVGGSGGGAQEKRCRDGDVIQSVRRVTTGSYVNFIRFGCTRWQPAQKRPEFTRENRCITNNINTCKQFGSPGGINHSNGPFFCPRGKVGKAFRGKHGIYIDSMKFVCDFWNK